MGYFLWFQCRCCEEWKGNEAYFTAVHTGGVSGTNGINGGRSVSFQFFRFFPLGILQYCEHSEAEVNYRSCEIHSSRKNSYGWVGAQDVFTKFVPYR